MDMIVIDLDAAPELSEGDWLECPITCPMLRSKPLFRNMNCSRYWAIACG